MTRRVLLAQKRCICQTIDDWADVDINAHNGRFYKPGTRVRGPAFHFEKGFVEYMHKMRPRGRGVGADKL